MLDFLIPRKCIYAGKCAGEKLPSILLSEFRPIYTLQQLVCRFPLIVSV